MRAVLRRGRLPGPGGVPRGPPLTVDLRSDTVTRPCARMRRAMARAAVGDDDYGEDPTVNELQRLAAGTLGMDSALFVPTATMANLIAVMCHCQRRGAQLFLGRDSHLHLYEHGGAAQVSAGRGGAGGSGGAGGPGGSARRAGGRPRAALLWLPGPVQGEDPLPEHHRDYCPGLKYGDLEPPCSTTVPCQLHAVPRPGGRWPVCTPRHCWIYPAARWTWSSWSWPSARPRAAGTTRALSSPAWRTRTARRGAGRCPSPISARSVGSQTLTGCGCTWTAARLMNAAVAQGVEPAQIAQHRDSVSLCFSKGLGACWRHRARQEKAGICGQEVPGGIGLGTASSACRSVLQRFGSQSQDWQQPLRAPDVLPAA